jgi:pimeloyl-ACP methyl ester carboxylesterase
MATDMQATKSIETSHLHMAYEETGDPKETPIVLVHGWPDDVRCWDKIAPELAKLGYRALAPFLRGCTPTTFRSAQTLKSGAIAALGPSVVTSGRHGRRDGSSPTPSSRLLPRR